MGEWKGGRGGGMGKGRMGKGEAYGEQCGIGTNTLEM